MRMIFFFFYRLSTWTCDVKIKCLSNRKGYEAWISSRVDITTFKWHSQGLNCTRFIIFSQYRSDNIYIVIFFLFLFYSVTLQNPFASAMLCVSRCIYMSRCIWGNGSIISVTIEPYLLRAFFFPPAFLRRLLYLFKLTRRRADSSSHIVLGVEKEALRSRSDFVRTACSRFNETKEFVFSLR